MTVVKSSLPEPERRITGDALQATLVDLLALSLIGSRPTGTSWGPGSARSTCTSTRW